MLDEPPTASLRESRSNITSPETTAQQQQRCNHHPRVLAGKRWKTQNRSGKRSSPKPCRSNHHAGNLTVAPSAAPLQHPQASMKP